MELPNEDTLRFIVSRYAHLRAAEMYTNAYRTHTNIWSKVDHHRYAAVSNLVQSLRAKQAPVDEAYAAAAPFTCTAA